MCKFEYLPSALRNIDKGVKSLKQKAFLSFEPDQTESSAK